MCDDLSTLLKNKTDGIFRTLHWIVDSLCIHVWKWYHVRIIWHVVLSSRRLYKYTCPVPFSIIYCWCLQLMDGMIDLLLMSGTPCPLQTFAAFHVCHSIWHLKVPPLTKDVVVFNIFKGWWSGILLFIQGVCHQCVWCFCPCICLWNSEHVWSIFFFGSWPLFGSPNKCHPIFAFGCWWFNDFWGFTYEPSLYSKRKVFVSTEDPKVIEKAGQLMFFSRWIVILFMGGFKMSVESLLFPLKKLSSWFWCHGLEFKSTCLLHAHVTYTCMFVYVCLFTYV